METNNEKIGLDTNILILLAVCPKRINEFKSILSKSKAYYSDISINEFMGVLINNYFFDKEETRSKLKNIVSELNLIKTGPPSLKNETRVCLANIDLIKLNSENEIYKDNDKTGKNDAKIIASFIDNGIMHVFTEDKAFAKTCEYLDIKSDRVPSKWLNEMEEIRKINLKIFGKKRKLKTQKPEEDIITEILRNSPERREFQDLSKRKDLEDE